MLMAAVLGFSLAATGTKKMRKNLKTLRMGILTSAMLASGAHAAEPKFYFRMPGKMVVAAVAPTTPVEPESIKGFSASLTAFHFTDLTGGAKAQLGGSLTAQLKIKNTGTEPLDISEVPVWAGMGLEGAFSRIDGFCDDIGILNAGVTKNCTLTQKITVAHKTNYCSQYLYFAEYGIFKEEIAFEGTAGALLKLDDKVVVATNEYETANYTQITKGCEDLL